MGNNGGVSFDPTVDKFTERKIFKRRRIEVEGEYNSFRQAEAILVREGFQVGSRVHPFPTPFRRAKFSLFSSEWKKLSKEDKEKISGIIVPLTSGGYREGALEIVYFI